MQFFIYRKKNSSENIIIRVNDDKTTEFFDYDGEWKAYNMESLDGEVHEITEQMFQNIKNSKYKFYFCNKRGHKLLVRIFNDLYLQIYDINANVWKKPVNNTWLSNILYDGDPDFEEVNVNDAASYISEIINNKKKVR